MDPESHVGEETIPRIPSVYLGEQVKYEVVIRRRKDIDLRQWKKVMTKLSCQSSFVPSAKLKGAHVGPGNDDPSGNSSSVFAKFNHGIHGFEDETASCTLLSTIVGTSFPSSEEQDPEARPFFTDKDTFIIPMSSSLQSLAGASSFMDLRVTLCLFPNNVAPSQMHCDDVHDASTRSPRKHDSSATTGQSKESGKASQNEADKFDGADIAECVGDVFIQTRAGSLSPYEEDKGCSETDSESPTKASKGFYAVYEKTVRQKFKMQGPPTLKLKLSCAGQKQFILLTVGNMTEKQMVVKSIEMLSGSTPVHDTCTHLLSSSSTKWESCHQLVNLEHPKKGQAFPAIVSPSEELSLIYRLHLASIPADSDLSLRCNLKWTHAGASNEITTVFKLPRIRVRCPPFIVTAKCSDQPVLSKPFLVTYNISNQLYDFMSMKLYYNLDNMKKNIIDKEVSSEEREKVQLVQEAVVCQDPIIHVSSCPRGTSIPVRVGFQIHKPGLYEMSELMKVNLGYSLMEASPDHHSSQSISTDTSSNMSLEDHLAASQQLWQTRGGSSTSLISPLLQSAEEKRQNFSGKSYSFGDLGPAVSPDTSEAQASRPKTIKRSNAVPPSSRPAPPRMLSQTEKDLVQPSNFLKLPFYIYIKDPNL